ncbi:MAG: hypothetical protein AAF583_16545 [Pseudomonadota bacterium]
MRRSIQSLQAFSFSSDFGGVSAKSRSDGMVSMTADELSEMLQAARQETTQHFEAENAKILKRLEQTSEDLRAALEHMIELAACLDRAKMEADDRKRARSLMASACQMIVDGQGELFDETLASTYR